MNNMQSCPCCGMTSSAAKPDGYWKLIESYERLAISCGSMPDLVELAKLRLSIIPTAITSSAQPKGWLAYDYSYQHVQKAEKLLREVMDIRKSKNDNIRQGN